MRSTRYGLLCVGMVLIAFSGCARVSRSLGGDGMGTGDGATGDQNTDDAGVPDRSGVPDQAGVPDGPAPSYTCKNPGDVVDPQSGPMESYLCVRGGYTCNILNSCDPGYTCTGSQCSCQDFAVCGLVCANDADCPPEWACHKGICREPLPCLDGDSTMCPQGRVCMHPPLMSQSWPSESMRDYCLTPLSPPPTKKPGDSCSQGADCMSLICVTNVCLQHCASNKDCLASGYVCSDVGSGSDLACVPAASSSCTGCTDPSKFCAYECATACKTNGDCSTGLCETDGPKAQHHTACGSPPISCAPAEITMYPRCALRQPCWLDSDCSSPYTCHANMSPPWTGGFCARTP